MMDILKIKDFMKLHVEKKKGSTGINDSKSNYKRSRS